MEIQILKIIIILNVSIYLLIILLHVHYNNDILNFNLDQYNFNNLSYLFYLLDHVEVHVTNLDLIDIVYF